MSRCNMLESRAMEKITKKPTLFWSAVMILGILLAAAVLLGSETAWIGILSVFLVLALFVLLWRLGPYW